MIRMSEDDFSKNRVMGISQEKLGKAWSEGMCNDKLGRDHIRPHGTQPTSEGSPDRLSVIERQML